MKLVLTWSLWLPIACYVLGGGDAFADATEAGALPQRRLLGGRPDFTWQQLPAGEFRERIGALQRKARARAEERLRGFSFPPQDLDSLRVDRQGGIFYADAFPLPAEPPRYPSDAYAVAGIPVPVSPFPTHLHFHSKPASTYILYLDFDGESVTGTGWNNSLGRDPIPALAFSTDGDYGTFSDSEQANIKSIWQRVAEDYAPFDIDVTTERPASFDSQTAHALITRSTDANGQPNPASGAGGVAYVGVFGSGSYDYHRPVWIYVNNLGSQESYIAEAASHEIGHNMGLSHDGIDGGSDTYSGHGSGDTLWAPVMGIAYARNVSQWSKGEYYRASNSQDDLAIIGGKVPQRADDHANTLAGATLLQLSDGSNIVSTTPETDPANTYPANKGVIEDAADVDLFSFVTAAGEIQLVVAPWLNPSSHRGGNLDISFDLLDDAGVPLATADQPASTGADLTTTVPRGQYYLRITGTGTGDPYNSTPTGYTQYGSIGQYFISGRVLDATIRVTNEGGAANVTHDAATLQGRLVHDGGLATTIHAFWGRTDKGDLSGEWEHSVYVGPGSEGPLSLTVSNLLPNTVYYYRFRAWSDPETAWGQPSAQFFTGSTVPFHETFDPLADGDIHAQNGWDVSADGEPGAALVQAQETFNGSAKACSVSSVELSHTFHGLTAPDDITWVDMYTIPQRVPDAGNAMPPKSSAKAVFYVDAETGFLEALDGYTPVLFTDKPAVPDNEWVRFTVRLEHARQTWHLWMNATTVVYNLKFFSTNNPTLSRIRLHDRAGGDASFVDNVSVSRERPAGILLVDSDGDAMDDDWELAHFASIEASDGGPDEDWDGDWFIDAHEFRANTVPTDSNSLLTIVDCRPEAPHNLVLRWQSASNRTYSVQRATNLLTGSWGLLAGDLPASPPLNQHTVSLDEVNSSYRITLEE